MSRHISTDNLVGQALDQRGFSYARLTHDNDIGLCATSQRLYHHAGFAFAAHDWIQFSGPCHRNFIDTESGDGLRGSSGTRGWGRTGA